jgi:hypothetical protein
VTNGDQDQAVRAGHGCKQSSCVNQGGAAERVQIAGLDTLAILALPRRPMDALADDVRRFVLTSIPSVPYLEAALLLRGSPGRGFSTADLAGALYMGDRAARELLQQLTEGGLVVAEAGQSGRVRWQPRDASVAASMDALAQAYATHLVEVTHLIHDATAKKAQRFADAFKLRKDR